MYSKLQHIFLADDDPDDVEIFQAALQETCPSVKLTVAKNGVELLALLHKMPKPQAIVLDLNMPVMCGKQCLLEIRQKQEFNDVPIIILSTSSQSPDVNFCMLNGADNYLVKPPTYEHMKRIAETLCVGK